jgi:hypothetical protein
MTIYRGNSVGWDPANLAPWSAPGADASAGTPRSAPPRQKPQHRTHLAILSQINLQLDRLHRRAGANEAALGQLLTTWEAQETRDTPVSWLTLIRLAELALLTAGTYADACEFQAAGDLLSNPMEIRVHLNGQPEPLTKPRHLALSTALRPLADPHQPFTTWFRTNALLEVAQRALLPVLTEIMAASGRITAPYRDNFTTRMKKVTDTIGFLHAWQVDDAADLAIRLKSSPPDTRAFIEANLCRFSDARFMKLGALIARLLGSRFPPRDRSHVEIELGAST